MNGAKKYVVGNWKMHGAPGMAGTLAADIAAFSKGKSVSVVLCPPLPLLTEVKASSGALSLGGQDCSAEAEGAYTGDVSAAMLKAAGCEYVIVGHSERRQQHQETSELVGRKAAAAMQAELKPIICIGETIEERKNGKAEAIVGNQLESSVPKASKGQFLLAYEPVWAIGSGETPTADDIKRMHAYIASIVPGAQVLYGGSVKAANAREILAIAGVSGVLVGGASLKAEEFNRIIEAA